MVRQFAWNLTYIAIGSLRVQPSSLFTGRGPLDTKGKYNKYVRL